MAEIMGFSFLAVFYMVYFLIYGILILLSIAVYVINALGIYTIAKRREIPRPWMAWIPVANGWILGSISDQYQQQVKNKETKRRKLIVIMDAVVLALVFVFYIFMIMMIATMVTAGVANELAMISTFMLYYVGMILFAFVLSAASIAQRIFLYISYYDLFASCDPDKAVIYLVLSIFVQYALPVLVFICRNKDDGMQLDEKQPEDCPEGEPVLICASEDENTDS